MRKGIRKNWKRLLSLILTLVMIGTGCNTYPVQAASSDAYSNGFEEAADAFSGLGGAKVQLSSALKQTTGDEQKTDSGTSGDAVLTKKVTFKKEAGGWTDAFVDLKALLPGTTKDALSKYQAVKVVISVDKVEADSSGDAVSKLFFQPNTTWNWCPGEEVKMAANTDCTLTLPVSKMNWGSGDTDTAAFGIQLANFKEGLEVNVTIKSFEMVKENESISSMSAYVKSGSAEVKYDKQYDITSANIDLAAFLPFANKELIMKNSAIEVVMNITTAEPYSSDKQPTATVFFMGDKTWTWGTGNSVPIKAGEDVKVTIPTANIKWGAEDTGVVNNGFGVQLNNLKEGKVDYNIVSVKFVSTDTTDTSKDGKTDVKDIGAAKSGNNFLYVSGRSNINAGAYTDVSKYLKAGNLYSITAWVKNIDKDADFIKLSWSKSPVSGSTLIGAVKAVKGEWTKIEATLDVPKSAKTVDLRFTSANANNDFGIDDVVIAEKIYGNTSQIKNYTVKDKDVKDGAVTLQGKTYNNLTIAASVGDADITLKNVTVVGKLTVYSDQASKIELYDTVVNKFNLLKSQITSSSIHSFAAEEDSIPTIVIGAGSNLLSFLAGADVELTQDEKSILDNIVVNPGKDGELEIVLKNTKCNLIVNSDPSSKINVKLENAQLNNVSVNSVINGGQVDFNGDTSSKIDTLNLNSGSCITSTISAAVTNLNVGLYNSTININGKVDNVKLDGDKGTVTIGKDAAVTTLTANGDSTKITADGSIGTMNVNGSEVDAKVNNNTKVEIKKGTSGSSVAGSNNVVDNNVGPTPVLTAPTPTPEAAKTNAILASNITKSLIAVKDPKYDDSCVLFTLNDYFSNYLTKYKLDSYKKIEIKLTVDNVTNYSEANQGKVTLYTLGKDWNWVEYDQPTLSSNKEITVTINTDKIAYGTGDFLNTIGLKFSQFATDTNFKLTIASIKLIASDTSQDEQQPDKAKTDLVVSSTAKTGTTDIEDQTWSGVGSIDLTSYFTATSKLKSTIDQYDYLEVKISFGDFNAFTGQTPKAKMYTKDGTDWKWADGGDTELIKNGTTTIRLPISKIVWGADGKATALGEAGLQLYGLAAGQKLSYTVESIKLIAPSTSSDDISGDYVELKDQGSYTSVNLDLISKLSDKTKATIDKYNYITVELDINKILLQGTAQATAVIFVQDNKDWSWKTSSSVNVTANSTLTIQIPTSDIIWGKDGTSTELAAFGVQFGGAGAGTKIGYTIKSVATTGLKDTNPSASSGEAITGDYVELKDQGSYTSVNLDLISKLSDKTKATIDKYSYITVELDINKILLQGATQANAVIFVQDNKDWSWKTSSSVTVEENKTLTIQIPTKDIIWGKDGTSTELAAFGVQFGGAGAGTKIGYSIKSVTLTGPIDPSSGGSTDPSSASGTAIIVSSVSGSAVTGSAVTVVSPGETTKGEVNISLKNLFTSDQLKQSYMMQYSTIEFKFTVDNIGSIDTSMWPGGAFYMKTGDSWTWSAGSWTNVSSGTVTFTLPTSNISWSSGTDVQDIGFKIANLPVGATVNYTIASLSLEK